MEMGFHYPSVDVHLVASDGSADMLEGCITLPITLLGYTFWPGLPSSPKRWYFTEEEHALAVRRIPHVEEEGITWKTFKHTILRPMFWIAVPCYM